MRIGNLDKGPTEPIPDIDRLFIDMLQLNQAHGGSLSMIGRWVGHRHPTWRSQHTSVGLKNLTKRQIIDIVLGLQHRDVKRSPLEVENTALQDADEVVKAFNEPGPVDSDRLLLDILEAIMFRDISMLGENPYNVEHRKAKFSGRPRREAPEGTPMTPQRDPWQSMAIFFVFMTPEERAKVHGPGYNLHPALEELCTELRKRLKEILHKEKRNNIEQWIYLRFSQLKTMWDEKHPHAKAELKQPPNYEI